ncbi:hypothetical protein TNCV_652111 [Trichonephila clavipes]|nr:hypothetical protein TNCV_652111 [Trichonephila clavipes]
MTNIFKRDSRANLLHIAADFNAGLSKHVTVGIINETSSIWGFGAKVSLVYPCKLYDAKLYASPVPVNADIRLLMTGNTLPGLASLVSNGTELMVVYGYGDNLRDPTCQKGSV